MASAGEIRAITDRLRSRVAQPTWVTVAGYGSERVHASVLAYALSQPHLSRKRLLAEMWRRASGQAVEPAAIVDDDLVVRRDERVAEGPDGTVDLVVAFTVGDERWRLGVRVKVDSMPRREEGARLLAGLRERGGARSALLLLALGSSQVSLHDVDCDEWQVWTPETLLELGPRILAAAGVDYVVGPWLEELETEQLRRDVAAGVRTEDAEALGYRGRTLVAYKLGALCAETNRETGASWQVSLRPGSVVAQSDALNRYRLTPRHKIWFTLELGESELALKAWSEPRLSDLQADTAALAVQACRLFWTYGLLASPPTHPRAGATSTLLTIPLRITGQGGVTTLVRASRAWESVASSLSLR